MDNKRVMVWVCLFTMFLFWFMCWFIGAKTSHAHDDYMWQDAEKYGPCYGHANCGIGYKLCWKDKERTVGEPYLFAPTAHSLKGGWKVGSCEELFETLEMCAEPLTDMDITFCTGDVDAADPLEEEIQYAY